LSRIYNVPLSRLTSFFDPKEGVDEAKKGGHYPYRLVFENSGDATAVRRVERILTAGTAAQKSVLVKAIDAVEGMKPKKVMNPGG
jgi:hypothetical protein